MISSLFIQQIRALLWKGFLIRHRHLYSTFIEFIVPIVLAGLLVWGTWKLPPTINNSYTKHYKAGETVPSTINPIEDFNVSSFNLLHGKKIYFVPETNETTSIMFTMSKVLSKINPKLKLKYESRSNEDELNVLWYNMSMIQQELLPGFIVFDNVTGLNSINGTFDVKIKQSGNKYPFLLRKWRPKDKSGPVDVIMDYNRGFLQLQVLIDEAYLILRSKNLKLKSYTTSIIDRTRRLPYPEHVVVAQYAMLDQSPMVIAYGISISFAYLIFRTCQEKSTGSKEMLSMAGLNRFAYWYSNFINSYIVMSIISLIQLAIIFLPLNGSSVLFANSSYFLITCLVLLYEVQLILFGQTLTILFNSPVFGTCISLVIFLFTFSLPDTFLNGLLRSNINSHDRRLSCLLPNSALVWTFRMISKSEIEGFGLNWYSLNQATITDLYEGLTVLQIILVQLISCVMYICAIWYLDQVWPWQLGIPLSFYFPFTREYWCQNPPSVDYEDDSDNINIRFGKRSRVFEEEPNNISKVIECKRLTKVFSSGWSQPSHVAVNDVNLNVYHGSITCLLGHNGAGKTTTMNMITGMFMPTRGSIRVNGFDLYKDTERARNKMSLCPQHNSLYDELTVGEHLFLYAAIKGHPWCELNTTVLETTESLSLSSHSTKKPYELSGGMKRKLCLGIALVGGSEIVILDEPSAGLDTEARRSMWDALKQIRHSRTILLTTHDMEEADALADRIVIMHSGKIICSGSSMFLKKALCTGYVLKILKSKNFKHSLTLDFIRKLMPKAIIKSDIGTEISFDLHECESSVALEIFFHHLESNKEQLGIDSFGVTVSTLDEVFLKMGELADNELGNGSITYSLTQSNVQDSSEFNNFDQCESRKVGFYLYITQFYGLLIKRLHNAKRYWLMLLFQLLLPSLMLYIAFEMTNPSATFPIIIRSLLLSPDLYMKGTVFLHYDMNDENLTKFADSFKFEVESKGKMYLPLDIKENMTEYLLNETYNKPFDAFMSNYIYGLSIEFNGNENIYTPWINIEAIHSLPLIFDLIYRVQDIELTEHTSILITNSLLPTHDINRVKSIGYMSIIWLLFVSLSMTFTAASFILFPISEVSSKAKLIQLMSGLNPLLFHLASFIFDWFTHLLCTLFIVFMFYMSDYYGTFISFPRNFDAMILLLLTFGSSVILIGYIFSNILSASQGFLILQILYCIIGAIFGLIASTVEYLFTLKAISIETYDFVIWILRSSPVFSLSWAFKKIHQNGVYKNVCDSIEPQSRLLVCRNIKEIYSSCCEDTCYDYDFNIDKCIYSNPYGWTGNRIGPELTMLLIEFTVLFFVLIVIEYTRKIVATFKKKPHVYISEQIDADVMDEKVIVDNLITEGKTNNESLVVCELKKKFGNFFAVKGISFTVHKNECFGLLGVNGAGKSTTFAMLTGDLEKTSGSVFQDSLQVSPSNLSTYQSNIGYCPQVNPIIDRLTGREMLFLFGRLRGIFESNLLPLSNELIRLVNLQNHADKPTGTYSGGNKRKLSIALAMIGNPKLVFLDEPTAGVDPAARRVIWTTLSRIRENYECSIILTSHSMDECEALCSRMAIMVSGEFVCLGSGQHLKNRFGQGYTLNIKLNKDKCNNDEFIEKLTFRLNERLKNVQMVDRHGTLVSYRISQQAGPWSKLFGTMEHLKEQFELEDYLLSDTTLEQIFMHFSRSQHRH